MPVVRVDEGSIVARLGAWRSRRSTRPVAGARVDGGDPWYFVADELIADAAERDLVDELVALGAEVIEEPPLPPPPSVVERRREVDRSRAPAHVRLRFEQPPDADLEALGDVLAGAGLEGERLVFGSEFGARVAAAVAPHRAAGRRVGLNPVGRPFQLALSSPVEGSGLVYGSDPTQWPAFAGSTRMVEAWQLVESVRQIRGGPSVMIAICDSGFWLDSAGAPAVAAGQPASDFGLGVLRWNLTDEGQPVPNGTTSFHGNQVASAAVAAVGNTAGAAGAGGTIATPAFFHTSRTADQAMRVVKLCVWWGIDIVNFSWGFWGQSEFWFDSDTWNDTFNWAADNDLVMVAAAGNFGWDLPGDTDHNIRPATRTPRVLTVGWLNPDDTANPSSDYGSSVNLWAPGQQIEVAPDGLAPGGSRVNGTSFASPIVAGVAAMMRYCDASLRADDVTRVLTDSGWSGAGRVTRGLDAYAAVWAALNSRLPDTNEPNGTVANPSALLPIGPGGSLAPGFGTITAIANATDYDYWSFKVLTLSSVTISVDWYQRLAKLSVSVQNTDPEEEDPGLAVSGSPTSGRQVLTGLLRAGTYRVRVGGTGPTAYRLLVKLGEAVVAADAFEPNDGFDTATRLAFVASKVPWLHLLLPEWGPGAFEATLHRTPGLLGWFYVNDDYYRLDVPAPGVFAKPWFSLWDTDELVDVTLYDDARRELRSWTEVRDVAFIPPAPGVSYVRVSGAKPTRYRLGTGMRVDRDMLPGPWQEELQFIPKWWGDPPPFWIDERESFHAVEVGEAELRDGLLAFAAPTGDALPAGVRLALLDPAGELLREAVPGETAHVIDLTGLESGTYVLSTTTAAHAEAGLGAGRVALVAVPPVAG